MYLRYRPRYTMKAWHVVLAGALIWAISFILILIERLVTQ